MYDIADTRSLPKAEQFSELDRQLAGLIEGEANRVANLANMAALIFWGLPDLNWAGFYLVDAAVPAGELVLGPFQGRVACLRIPFGRGVCGAAAATRQTQIVPDVHAFPGHIACDSASRSELVVPITLADGSLFGVLDLDSPIPDRFDPEDAAGCQRLVRRLAAAL